ncbi:MAG: hypothetical protein WDO13_03215 [Verrucomicrobiota bacterium]
MAEALLGKGSGAAGRVAAGVVLALPALVLALVFGSLLASGNAVFGSWAGTALNLALGEIGRLPRPRAHRRLAARRVPRAAAVAAGELFRMVVELDSEASTLAGASALGGRGLQQRAGAGGPEPDFRRGERR